MNEEKAQKLIDKMRSERGYLLPEWALMAKQDPDYMEAYDELYKQTMTKEKHLPIKVKELVAIVGLSARGEEEGIEAHINRAIRHGATVGEIVEALQVGVVTTGTPTMFYGLKVLRRILEAKEKSKDQV